MGELTPVTGIDGRIIENKSNSNLFEKIYTRFKEMTLTVGEVLDF